MIDIKLIDHCISDYIKSGKVEFKKGDEAEKEFHEVESTLNVDGAFKFERKTINDIPCLFMYSAKSNTLIQVYFAINDEAGHIEFSVDELKKQCTGNKNKEDSNMINETGALLLKNAKLLIEAACANCDALEDAKESLEDAVEKIDSVIDGKEEKKEEKVDEKTKEVVNETIAALYEKATMTESVELANACIEKAEELQKAIDDIPEETPSTDDEYPADDVTGGQGEEINQEEVKELVGEDNDEALKLLNTDSNSITINA